MRALQLTVLDVAARSQIIAQKCESSTQKETFFQYLSGAVELPVIQVELNLPVYRLSNYRTQTQQEKYIRDRKASVDFFRNGQENVSAQEAQHKILLEFAKTGSGETIIPIYDVLEEGKVQNESLILTREGVVVNGNRRLAAMRELYDANAAAYPNFCSIRARVLPPGLTAVEIKRIETRLQMVPQTLLPYDWVNQALAIRDLRSLGVSDSEIAAEMKLDGPEQVEVLLDRLREGELYMREHLHVEDHERIIPHKQQFIELQKAIGAEKDAAKKEVARRIAYVITNNADKLGRRAYEYRIAYGAELDSVINALSDRLGIEQEADESAPAAMAMEAKPASEDLFSDEEEASDKYGPLIQRLDDLTQKEANANEIADICENIREMRRQRDFSQAALKNIQRANTLLQQTSIETASKATLSAIQSQLAAVIARANALSNAVSERQSGK